MVVEANNGGRILIKSWCLPRLALQNAWSMVTNGQVIGALAELKQNACRAPKHARDTQTTAGREDNGETKYSSNLPWRDNNQYRGGQKSSR
jgi:hypothetical protein